MKEKNYNTFGNEFYYELMREKKRLSKEEKGLNNTLEKFTYKIPLAFYMGLYLILLLFFQLILVLLSILGDYQV